MSEALGFAVRQDVFEGTLTELAYALRTGAVSPSQLDLAPLVADYLYYFEALAKQDLDLATEVLPQVAHIVELKVRLLLPRPPSMEDDAEAVPEEQVLEAIFLLEELEEAISFLRVRRSERRGVLAAKAPKPNLPRPERPVRVPIGTLANLAARYRIASYFEFVVERFTLAQAIGRLVERLRRLGKGSLFEVVDVHDWAGRSVVFAGLLELVKTGRVRARQSESYGTIDVEWMPEEVEIRDVA